jgi:hypothetical protein
VIADGPDAEALGEELEDAAVVAAQLDDRPRLEPAQPEAAFAREEAAEMGQQVCSGAVERRRGRLDITPHIAKRAGVVGHRGMEGAAGVRVIRDGGPAIDRTSPDLEVAALTGS